LRIGRELLLLHLHPEKYELRSKIQTNIQNTTTIAKGFPQFKENRIYLNSDKWVSYVSVELWNFRIGKYQICKKWLKDRRNRSVSNDEILWYCRILSVLKETIRLMKAIDSVLQSQTNP
jgi:hypothetical protein